MAVSITARTGDHDIHLHLGQVVCLQGDAAVVFRLAAPDAAAQGVGDNHAGNALPRYRIERFIYTAHVRYLSGGWYPPLRVKCLPFNVPFKKIDVR